jgi:4-aminobutyrate aminotransferase-like enzyme
MAGSWYEPIGRERIGMSRGSDIVERLRRLEGGGLRTFAEDPPFVWERAEGCHVEDADGRRYLDLYGGFAVAAIGYAHPKVVEAIQRQAATLMHCPSAHPSRVRAEFYEALASIAPAGLERFLPAVTGAMANEIAILLARAYRPKGAIVTFEGSYFGRSVGTVGFAGKTRYREALGVPAGGPFVPFPYPLRQGAAATDRTMQALEELARREEPLAAVILEPIQGNGGVVIPPADFLPRLRQFCDRQGALMILDEIQSGCGRTGRLWAVEHGGVTPDLMTVGKGIGGGVAVAAVMGRTAAMSWKPDSYTSTFLTNNLNLAAATAAIGVLRDEQLAGRAAAIGPVGLDRLRQALAGIAGVREVRGLGLWYAAELTDAAWAGRAVKLARERGVIVGRSGYEDNVVKLSPALAIPEADLHAGIDILAGAIGESRGETA